MRHPVGQIYLDHNPKINTLKGDYHDDIIICELVEMLGWQKMNLILENKFFENWRYQKKDKNKNILFDYVLDISKSKSH